MLPLLCLISLEPPPPPDFQAWGRETVASIEQRYSPENGRFAEWVDGRGSRSDQPAFLWGMGVALSAYAAAARAEGRQGERRLARIWQTIRSYGLGELEQGLGVWPGQAEPDRYYDDNAWVCLALVEAGVWLKKPEYTKASAALFKFVLSGEDDRLGGGIYWREREKTSKNACSNAPAALVAYKLDAALGDPSYRKVGDRLMEWLGRLRDTDGLYFDAMRLDGTVEKTKWSYNSALPIRARLARYGLLRSRKDLDEARRIGEAAIARWVDPGTGLIQDDASFAHHLAEAFLELGSVTKEPRWTEAAHRALVGLRESIRTKEGLYGKWWNRRQPETDPYLLLYQSSAARAFYMAALERR